MDLDRCNAFAECVEIALGDAGHDLHQRPAADLARGLSGQRGQLGERAPLVVAMHAFDGGVDDQHNSPHVGKREMRHDRRRVGVRSAPDIDDEAATLEQRRAGARSPAAIENARVLDRIVVQPMQPPQAACDRERELRPGPETGMRRNRQGHGQGPAGIELQPFRDAERERGAAPALVSKRLKFTARDDL